MKRKVNPFKLGLFVLLSLTIGVGVLIWIGAASIFQKTRTYASFFDFAVAGLQRGASVERLGVPVGQVSKIRLVEEGKTVMVLLKIEKDFRWDKTMVLQPSQQGLTGQAYLSIVSAESSIPTPEPPFDVDYPVVPNRRGEMDRIMEQVKKVAETLAETDISALVKRVEKTVSGAEALVNDPDLRLAIGHIRSASAGLDNILSGLSGPRESRDWQAVHRDVVATATNLRNASDKLARLFEDVPPDAAGKIVTDIRETVATGKRTIGSWDRQVERNLGLMENTIREIDRLVREMDRLVNTLRQEPGRILERRKGTEPFER